MDDACQCLPLSPFVRTALSDLVVQEGLSNDVDVDVAVAAVVGDDCDDVQLEEFEFRFGSHCYHFLHFH